MTINELYTRLDVDYLKRVRAATSDQAGVLIEELERQVCDFECDKSED